MPKRVKRKPKPAGERLLSIERRLLTLERIVAHEANDTVWPMPPEYPHVDRAEEG
jgi:hypothetical protein